MVIKTADEEDEIFTQFTNNVMIAEMGGENTDNFVAGEKFTNSKQFEYNLRVTTTIQSC